MKANHATDAMHDLPLVLGQVPECFRAALVQEGVPHGPQTSSDGSSSGRFYLHDVRLEPRPQLLPGQTAINVRGLLGLQGTDALEALANTGTMRGEWQVQGWHVQETIAAVDHRAVRRQLLGAIQAKVEQAGGIWARLAAYPFPYQSAFNFRLDCDEYAPADFHAALDAEAGFEDCFSHYVCGAAYQHQPAALARLQGLHVGGHGFYHYTYRDAAENLRNIRRGLDVLTAAGLQPDGFVAPHGRYTAGLAAAMNECGLSHSSEFALCYQDWPFMPAGSKVLQVPVHPVCLGIFLDVVQARCAAGAPAWKCAEHDAVTALERHFCQVVARNHAAGEPAFLYGHPERRLGRYSQVIRGVLQTVKNCPGMWRTTLAQFAEWWRQREQVQCTVWQGEHGLTIDASRLPMQKRAALEIHRGDQIAKVELVPGQTALSLGQLSFQRLPAATLPVPRPVQPPGGLKARLRTFLDWERTTPWPEIHTATWRGWAKQRLRRWQAASEVSSLEGFTESVHGKSTTYES